MVIVRDGESTFGGSAELFLELHSPGTFVVPEQIINGHLYAMGGVRGVEDDVGDVIGNVG